MKTGKLDRTILTISVCGFFLMAVSFLLMPVEALRFLPGALFWGGLVLGVSMQLWLESRRRAMFAAYAVDRRRMQKPRCGLLSFGSSPLAKAVDWITLCSIAGTALAFALTHGNGYVCYVCIATTVFFFCLHCVVNGRNCFHVNNLSKVRQVLEQKKASMEEEEK